MGEDVNDILRNAGLEPEGVGGVGELGIAIIKVLGLDQRLGDGMSTIGGAASGGEITAFGVVVPLGYGNITSILEGTGQNIIKGGVQIVLNGRRHLHLRQGRLVLVVIPNDGGRKHAPAGRRTGRNEIGSGRSGAAASASAAAADRVEGAGGERPNEGGRPAGRPPPSRAGEVGSRHRQDGHALLTAPKSASSASRASIAVR